MPCARDSRSSGKHRQFEKNVKNPENEKWKLVLSPSRSELVVQSSRFCWRNPRREIYNLGMVSGPVLLRIKGKRGIFMNKWKSRPCFDTKSVRFGRTELSISRTGGESRDLEIGHGFRACSFKSNGKKLDFHTLGGWNLVLSPSRSDLVVQSSRFFWRNLRREIYK